MLQTALSVWQPYIGDVPVLFMVFRAVEYLTLCGAYCALIVFFTSAKNVKLEAKRRMLRMYSLLFVALLTLLLGCNLARELRLIMPSAHAFLGAAIVLAANMIPLLCRKMFFARGFGTLSGQSAMEMTCQELRIVHNIFPRENEVLELICDGHSNQEIADILFLSVQTVKDHTSHIYRKIGVKNRAQLVAVPKSRAAQDGNLDK